MTVDQSAQRLGSGLAHHSEPATLHPDQQNAHASRHRSSSMPTHMYHHKDDFIYPSTYTNHDQPDAALSQPRNTMPPPHLPLSASLDSVLLPPSDAPTVTPSSLTRTPTRSKSGMLVVTDFAPSEGEENVPFAVGVLLDANALPDGVTLMRNNTEIRLRLVFGRTAVKTNVNRMLSVEADMMTQIEGREFIHLKLKAYIPPYTESRFPEQRGVPMSVQIMEGQAHVIESFTFGMFTYWGPATVDPAGTLDNFAYTVPSVVSVPYHLKRKSEDAGLIDIIRPAPRAPVHLLTQPIKPTIAPASSTLVRLSAAPAEERDSNSEAQEAELEWVTSDRYPDPNTLDKKWTHSESEMGRRLIRFKREQVGNKLFVSCEVIPEEAYNEDDIVISCIRRSETRNCWFTSVDVIYLLERLVGNPFSTEEKNRIRRNLEGFKPTTVSKHKPGMDAFFQRIMDFPPPKPRNIEKDVKVFPWSVLGSALDKIIQKYSVIPCAPNNSSPQESLSDSSSSHELSPIGQFHGLDGHYSFPNNGPVNVHHPEHSEYLKHLLNTDNVMQHDVEPYIPEYDATHTTNTDDDLYGPSSQPEISDDWRRRASIASTLSATSEMYQELDGIDSAAGSFQAFSNPFAGNINLSGHPIVVHDNTINMDGSYNFGHRMSSFPNIHALHLSDGDVPPHNRHSMDGDFVYPPVHLGM